MPTGSAVRDGKIDTRGIDRDPTAASGKGQAPPPSAAPPQTYDDPTQDPEYAGFVAAQKEGIGGFQDQRTPAAANESFLSGLPPEVAAMLEQDRARVRDAQTSSSPKPVAPAAAAPAAGQPAPSATPAAAQPKTTGTPEDIAKRTSALAALKRDGWTDAVIAKLSDEELLTVGSQRHESQAAVDLKLQERREAHRETSAPTPSKPDESGATPASGGPGQTAPPTFDVAVKEAAAGIAQQFTEQFGDEIGKPVGSAFEAGLKKIAAPILQQNATLMRAVEMLANFVEESVASDVRRGWKDEFPATADEKTWEQIEAAQATLAATGKYAGRKGMLESYEHARRIVMPGAQPASATTRNAAEDADLARKQAGALNIGTRGANTAPLSEDAEEFKGFLAARERSASLLSQLGPEYAKSFVQ